MKRRKKNYPFLVWLSGFDDGSRRCHLCGCFIFSKLPFHYATLNFMFLRNDNCMDTDELSDGH